MDQPIITGWRNNRGVSVFYTYDFAGHRYHETDGVSLKRESIGSFYLVKINPKTPTESKLLKDYCLGDSVQLKQPDSGWRENPMTLQQSKQHERRSNFKPLK